MYILFLIIPLLWLSIASAISEHPEELPETIIYNLEEADVHFSKFIKEHDKRYDETEAKYRFEVFKDNLKRFNEWNMRNTGAVFGITSLADLTREEFLSLGTKADAYVPYEINNQDENYLSNDIYKLSNDTPIDWRKKGAVTEVRDQGRCASSYIFSAIGVVEGQYAMKTKKLVSFSVQQALDCRKDVVCNSTDISAASILRSLKPNGVTTEAKYPYTQEKGTCKYNKSNATAFVKFVNEVTVQNEISITKTLAVNGPTAIRLTLSEEFQGYKGGIINPKDCKKRPWELKLPMHYFLLVAADTENNVPYWVLKNSWGKKWGEQGYVRILRFAHTCNVGDNLVFAIVK